MPKTQCYLDLDRCAAQVEIEIGAWNLEDIFFYLFQTKSGNFEVFRNLLSDV